MKAIKLIYNKNNVEFTLYVQTFFRLVGIYVSEEYLNGNMELCLDLPELKKAEERYSEFNDYDVYICIIDSSADANRFFEYRDKNRNRTLLTIATPASDSNLMIRNQSNQEKYEKNATVDRTIINLLCLLEDLNVISAEERKELTSIWQIVYKNDFVRQFFLSKYFYNLTGEYSDRVKKCLNGVLDSFLKIFDEYKINWGADRYQYTQFATINLYYELLLYAKKNNEVLDNREQQLLFICKNLNKYQHFFLENSVKVLIGNILNDLMLDPNHAYESFVSACENEYNYNAFVYFKKGLYWQNFVGDEKKAIQYFSEAIVRHTEYYRAWYRIGMCYKKRNELDNAIKCFQNVEQCIIDRIRSNVARPLEYDYIIKSEIQIVDILTAKQKYGNALDVAQLVGKIYDSIENSLFFDFMANSNIELSRAYKKITRDNLPMRHLVERINFLNHITT